MSNSTYQSPDVDDVPIVVTALAYRTVLSRVMNAWSTCVSAAVTASTLFAVFVMMTIAVVKMPMKIVMIVMPTTSSSNDVPVSSDSFRSRNRRAMNRIMSRSR